MPDACLIGAMAAASVAGCASRPINQPTSHVDTASGYSASVRLPKQQNNDPNALLLLAFSGGGTRAAAFSYGVLEELRRTEVVVDGQRRRLLDEVDLISGVSGGSMSPTPRRSAKRWLGRTCVSCRSRASALSSCETRARAA